ncbi:MAG: glycosyl transferase [Methanomicrobiales archaeon HGW-Methanomicrobiales-5]|nr:MAG: glycosyl transferase [Methanomicrobiales archaeon HGW-Methanomicrobiales-5]
MISVIIPAYNEEATIQRCLVALSNQTVPRSTYELIVVDGNSSDRTREIAAEYADIVFIQEAERVSGARNDGFGRAKYDIVATTDADSIAAPDWIEQIQHSFTDPQVVLAFGPVTAIEDTPKNRRYVLLFDILMRFGAITHIYYYTLGCNTIFRYENLKHAGMYKIMDAGDDLEVATRMRKEGRVIFNPGMKVGFDFRRYDQYGFWQTIFEWYWIVLQGGISQRFTYTKRVYTTRSSNENSKATDPQKK